MTDSPQPDRGQQPRPTPTLGGGQIYSQELNVGPQGLQGLKDCVGAHPQVRGILLNLIQCIYTHRHTCARILLSGKVIHHAHDRGKYSGFLTRFSSEATSHGS